MEQNQQVQKFDPSTLMQGVKDRIKATFVSLIPDDQWDGMVKKEIDAFFDTASGSSIESITVEIKDYGYGTERRTWQTMKFSGKMSPFRQLVWTLCYEESIKALKKYISEEYFTNVYVDGRTELHENMKAIIAETAPLAVTNFMQAMMFSNNEQLRSQFQNFRG
jgi:hypothetical protein